MRIIVSLVGVHGVGKTYTARILRNYGFQHFTIDAIDDVYRFNIVDPMERQLFFFSTYLSNFIKILRSTTGLVVIDTHPIMVIPYTKYWLSRYGYGTRSVEDVVEAMIRLVKRLPKVDLMVLIKPNNIETVLNRIKERNRMNVGEEFDAEYVEYISRELSKIFDMYGHILAHKTLSIDAEIDGEKRAEIIAHAVTLIRTI